MKHRNPTHQHALLALLASLSLSGCQWDSVLYDSYIDAFGENGAGGRATAFTFFVEIAHQAWQEGQAMP